MTERKAPTRLEVQEAINRATRRDDVLKFLAEYPRDVAEKVEGDLLSYAGWEELNED